MIDMCFDWLCWRLQMMMMMMKVDDDDDESKFLRVFPVENIWVQQNYCCSHVISYLR